VLDYGEIRFLRISLVSSTNFDTENERTSQFQPIPNPIFKPTSREENVSKQSTSKKPTSNNLRDMGNANRERERERERKMEDTKASDHSLHWMVSLGPLGYIRFFFFQYNFKVITHYMRQ